LNSKEAGNLCLTANHDVLITTFNHRVPLAHGALGTHRPPNHILPLRKPPARCWNERSSVITFREQAIRINCSTCAIASSEWTNNGRGHTARATGPADQSTAARKAGALRFPMENTNGYTA
jgi:hypothetical protein